MWTVLLLAACGGAPVVDVTEAASAKAPFIVEAELKSVKAGRAVLGDGLEVRLAVKRTTFTVGQKYRARVEKKAGGFEVTCIEDAPYRCGGEVVPIHDLGETGVVEGILRSAVVCPRCPPEGKCEPCTAKVVVHTGHTIYLHGFLEVPPIGTLVRLAVRRVKDWPLGFPGIEATCIEPVAR